jgi:ketosteroid isomerase-like protein
MSASLQSSGKSAMQFSRAPIIFVLVILMAGADLALGQGEDERKAIESFFGEYGRAVGSFDAQRLLAYYDSPLTIVTAARTVVLKDATEIQGFMNPFLERLKQRGWTGKAESPQINMRWLGAGIALASVLVVRYKADDAELERGGFTYVLRKTGDQWKIAVLVGHDVSGVKTLD